MPRRYRSSRRFVVSRAKWSPHFKSFSMSSGTYLLSLVDNSFSTATPTPSVIKVKHVKVEGDVQLVGTFASMTNLSLSGKDFRISRMMYLAPILYAALRSQL